MIVKIHLFTLALLAGCRATVPEAPPAPVEERRAVSFFGAAEQLALVAALAVDVQYVLSEMDDLAGSAEPLDRTARGRQLERIANQLDRRRRALNHSGRLVSEIALASMRADVDQPLDGVLAALRASQPDPGGGISVGVDTLEPFEEFGAVALD